MCARHVDSTNPGRSNLVFRSKPIAEAEMSNRLILYNVMLASAFSSPPRWTNCSTCSITSWILILMESIMLLRSAIYCIVLYLYIYIALLEVHTNQKRFQCERPRKKRAVLRERKETLDSPVNKVDRVEGRSCFQSERPIIARARV